jgi:single-strand DNA-binding protein
MATNGNSSSNNGDHPRSANGYMKIVAVGNLGRDPEMRYTPSGKAVTNFSLAINLRTYDPEAKEQVVHLGQERRDLQPLSQAGLKVLIEAEDLTFDPQTGGPVLYKRQDGSAGADFECSAFTVRFLDSRGNEHTVEAQTEQEEVIQFG